MTKYVKRQILRIIAFVLLITIYLINSSLLELATAYAGKNAGATNRFIGAMLIMVAALLVLFSWLYHRQLKRYNPRHFGSRAFNVKQLTRLLIAFIIIFLVQAAWSQLIVHHILPMPSNQSALEGELRKLPLWNNLYSILIAPVFEEYIFRGFFFNFFFTKNSRWNTILGVIIGGLIFGFLHTLSFSITTILYASLGWVLAGTYLYFKDLRYSIALHILNNLMSVL